MNTDLEPMSYNHWFPGEPDNSLMNGVFNCASLRDVGNKHPWIHTDGSILIGNFILGNIDNGKGLLPFVPGWIDAQCATVSQYICQKEVEASPHLDLPDRPDASDAATIGSNCFQFTIIFVLFRQ